MAMRSLSRIIAAGFVAGAALAASLAPAQAVDKVTFLTNWFAQAEHGGFYQAKATGLYEKAGLDVTIKIGGPQVNGSQLLLAGDADFMMGYDIQVLKGREQNLPLVTVASSFQFDLQGIMTHDDVADLAALKGRPILIAGSSRTTFWPWLRAKYGYTDDQIRPYTFNLQPFFADKTVAQQAYPSSEPYQAEQQNEKAKFFLLADDGYPPYGSTIVTTEKMIADKPDVVARFVKASLEGWRDYMKNPAPANALIKADNAKMTDGQLAFAIEKMKKMKAIDRGDATTRGVGIITADRYEKIYDFLVTGGLLDPKVDWHKTFDDRFVKDLKIGVN
ncbi:MULTISPECIES: ABC transporter substrate-binding protein [unclassified Bradyrhizobium]|uniref:ABC transporter substrate-binding protein n=1 Tax=unclassified Bradyrhizobium TaxID=2631580 RepID=UPI001FF8ECBB|nr:MULTISPECIES: ABC transporter substrate-binding protein [unclassified Bradyrhizobium]MCK1713388.1 ABC transporter substrate-binding protein [Bradyrhizobium sp. 143]MCK1730433.1 ABC transporter substrate-binding protein [Bradyrhizobium sp. 142]